jgi:hypothetical protein
VETVAAGSGPSDFSLGVSRSISVTNSSGFSVGKFVYIAGPGTDPKWAWIRAELTGVTATALTLIPRDTGTTDTTIHFSAPPAVVLEEANSIYLSSSSVRRATATDTSNAASPVWSPANEIGRNFSALTFAYYDMYGNAVQPASLSNRMAIARVDIQLTVRAATALSNGTRPTYSLALRTIPRNMRAHLSQ